MFKKVREYINTNIIGKNTILVEEMKYRNHNYGRPEKLLQRAMGMAGLFWKYRILKLHPLDVREKVRKKLPYPESRQEAGFDEKLLWKRLEGKEILVIDFWQVLCYFSLSKEQLWVLLETCAAYPGLAEVIKCTGRIPESCEEKYEELFLDFTMKNQKIFEVIDKVKSRNIRVFIKKNQEEKLSLLTQRLLKQYHLEAWEEAGQDRNKVLYLTTHPMQDRDCLVYQNVNALGAAYRSHVRENAAVQVYNQIVNLKLHSANSPGCLFYEYGFVYGGILACGFCQFLNDLVESKKIDKLLFVARDGHILHQIYEKYFKKAESCYLLFSRTAALELLFDDFPEEYIDKNMKARIYSKKRKDSIGQILKSCGIGSIEKELAAEGIDTLAPFGEDNYMEVRAGLLRKKEKIQEIFSKSCDAAGRYFLSQIGECKNICIVDVGWHGKSIVYLKHLLKNRYGFQGNVIGAQIGASADKITQQHIQNQLIFSYAFSDEYFRATNHQKTSYMSDREIVCMEALFSSPEKTLLRYGQKEEGTIEFLYGEHNKNSQEICEIHRGIKDFAREYSYYLKKYHWKLSGRDSYTPLNCFLQNIRNQNQLLKEYKEGEDLIHSHSEE